MPSPDFDWHHWTVGNTSPSSFFHQSFPFAADDDFDSGDETLAAAAAAGAGAAETAPPPPPPRPVAGDRDTSEDWTPKKVGWSRRGGGRREVIHTGDAGRTCCLRSEAIDEFEF